LIKIERKIFFLKFPNPKVYPILKECQTALSLYASLNDDHDLKKARQALIDRIGKIFIFTLLLKKKSFLLLLGVNDYPHGIVELYDEIASRQVRRYSF
jgi:hypothetical protein